MTKIYIYVRGALYEKAREIKRRRDWERPLKPLVAGPTRAWVATILSVAVLVGAYALSLAAGGSYGISLIVGAIFIYFALQSWASYSQYRAQGDLRKRRQQIHDRVLWLIGPDRDYHYFDVEGTYVCLRKFQRGVTFIRCYTEEDLFHARIVEGSPVMLVDTFWTTPAHPLTLHVCFSARVSEVETGLGVEIEKCGRGSIRMLLTVLKSGANLALEDKLSQLEYLLFPELRETTT